MCTACMIAYDGDCDCQCKEKKYQSFSGSSDKKNLLLIVGILIVGYVILK
jgi:hypothetical protein